MTHNTKIEWADATWNPIPGWSGYYVTADGRIGSQAQELKPQTTTSGHLYVMIRRRKLYVHHAVLFGFVGYGEPGQECRHLDGDPTNNRVGNLKWGTRVENCADKRRHGHEPRGPERWCAKLTQDQRDSIIGLYSVVGGFSARRLASMFGVSHTTVLRVVREARCG